MPEGERSRLDPEQRIIWLNERLTGPESRCQMAHRLAELVLGAGASKDKVARWAARRLIPFKDLARAFKWTLNLEEMAEELWVDKSTLRTRLRCMTDREQDRLMQAIASRRDET